MFGEVFGYVSGNVLGYVSGNVSETHAQTIRHNTMKMIIHIGADHKHPLSIFPIANLPTWDSVTKQFH